MLNHAESEALGSYTDDAHAYAAYWRANFRQAAVSQARPCSFPAVSGTYGTSYRAADEWRPSGFAAGPPAWICVGRFRGLSDNRQALSLNSAQASGCRVMLGENLLDLVEQAARWRLLSAQIRDQRALDALAAALAVVEIRISRVEAEIFAEAC